jgi:molybdopterin synthase catalytic subunit
MVVRIEEPPFDPGAELNAFILGEASNGATVTFTGLVRSSPHDQVSTLTLECYPELAVNEIGKLVAEATSRFELSKVTVIHRYGTMQPGEPIMQVLTLAPHREAAFKGAEFLMDYLKTGAPFWKREATPAGDRWVEAKAEDDAAKARWTK